MRREETTQPAGGPCDSYALWIALALLLCCEGGQRSTHLRYKGLQGVNSTRRTRVVVMDVISRRLKADYTY
jgi:hypothetical protein